MAVVFKNNAKTTLASGINSSATSITVSDGDVFPSLTGSDIFFVTFDDGTNNEIVKVTARSGNTLTVVRAQESTTARSFSTGDEAQLRLTAGILGLFSQTGVAITDEIEAYLDANGLTFPDNVKAQFGASNDLQIYHDGNDSIISDEGTGGIKIFTAGVATSGFYKIGGEELATFEPDGAVTLYHNDIARLATTSTGTTVTGTLTATTLAGTLSTASQPNITSVGSLSSLDVGTITSTGNLVLNQDSGTIFIGADLDMRILHDGSNGTFRNDTGNLTVDVGGDIILDADGGDIRFRDGGTEVGTIVMDDGSNSFIFKAIQQDADIKFNGNDGGSGINALTLDMSNAGAATFNSTISATSYSGALASTVTATTQSAGDNSTKVATTAYTDTAIANLADSAPSTLNTLNELAAALGDDANFSTTVTNSIATKLPLAGGTMTGDLNMGSQNLINTQNIRNNDIDFIVQDTTDSITNFIWRDHSASKLYLGTADAQVELRSALNLQSGHDIKINGTTVIDSSKNLTNIGTISSGAITASGNISSSGVSTPEFELAPSGSVGNADIKFDGTSLDIRSNSSGAFLTLQTATTERLKITNTGNFEFNNGNLSEVGTISSGAITVNTADLTIEGGANASTRALVIKHTGQTGNQTKLENVSNGVYGRLHATERALRIEAGSDGGTGASETLSFYTNGSRAMTIDTSQRVGIGTLSPESILHISNNAAPADDLTLLTLQNGNSTGDIGTPNTFIDFQFKDSNSNVVPQARIGAHAGDGTDANTQILEGKGYLTFHTSDTTNTSGTEAPPERLRITHDGNLLVNTTNTAPYASSSVGGMVFRADFNLLGLSRNNNYALSVNRYGNNGDIVNLRKDGTTVGSIGSEGGDSLFIQGGTSSGSGLLMHGTGAKVLPLQNGASVDATIDLGQSSRRFKDLHLSGDILLPYGSINDSGTDLVIHGTNAVVLKTDGGTALTIPNNSTDINLGSGKLNFSRTSEAILLDSAHSKTKIGLFGGIGTGAEYIGTSANTVEISGTNINFNGASGSGTPNLKMGTTTVIDSSRNLTNIGTITASGDITTADRIISKESSGGFYKLHTDGTFRAAFYDDNGNTQIYADGDGSNPFITFSGGATHTTDIDGILNLSNTNASLRIGGTEVISTGRNIANIGTISSGNITASGSSGAVITAEHNGGGVANDDFIGGFIFKNNDSSGTEPHYAGITARAHNIYGAMGLEFFADRADYENDTPAMALSPDGTDSSLNTLDLLSATKIQGITSISSGAITTTGHIQQNNANEIRSKDTGGSVRTIMRVNSSNELEYGWSGNGKVKIMGGGSYTERFSIGTDGNATFAGSISSVNDITIPSSSGGDGFIKLGSYLNIYGRNRSNTAAITINTTYDGAELNTYTPIYSGAASAGQFIMKQESGGHGTVDVFVKTHGTNSASAGISTFTQVAQFNDAGYFDASNGLYVNGTSVISSSRNLTNIQRINTADGINDAGTAGSSTIFNENGTTADFRVESTDNTHMLFVDGGLNRVGINRSSPNTTLHVNSGSTNINTRLESTDTAVILQLKDTTGIAAIESRNDFRFKVDTSTERMRLKNGGDLNLISGAYQINGTSVIDSSRNLTNIGTATAANFVGTGSYHEIGNNTGAVSNDGSWNARLNISGTSHARLDLFEDADNSLLRLYVHHGQSAHVGTTSSTDLVFETNDSARFKADASGLNIVSGHSIRHNSTTVLDSSRNLSNIASLGVGGSAGTQYPGFFQSGQRYLIGIKNTASGVDGNYPWLVHDNSNSMAALIVHFNGVGDRMTLREDGNAIFTGDVTAFSDERLKDNIQTLDGKKALQMRGVSYIRDGKEGSGVIAQEIEKIAPELVITADDEQGTKSVAYGNLVGYLIEAIKEQQDQIEYMKSEIKVLKEANNGNK